MSENCRPGTKVAFDEAGAERMMRLARGIFAPIYPVLAGQIVARLGITFGWGLDIGTGPGSLGLALAEQTNLSLILLDASAPMLSAAVANVAGSGLGARCRVTPGNVQALPLGDNSMQLIVSRGSIFFWEDLVRAFGEIYRVLAPSGRTYLGGGFGTAELRDQIAVKMAEQDPNWQAFRDRNLGQENKDRIRAAFKPGRRGI